MLLFCLRHIVLYNKVSNVISTLTVPYSWRRMTSGEMYSGVPNTCLSLNCLQSLSIDPSYNVVVTAYNTRQRISAEPEVIIDCPVGSRGRTSSCEPRGRGFKPPLWRFQRLWSHPTCWRYINKSIIIIIITLSTPWWRWWWHVQWVTLSFRNTIVLHRSVTPNLKSNCWTLV